MRIIEIKKVFINSLSTLIFYAIICYKIYSAKYGALSKEFGDWDKIVKTEIAISFDIYSVKKF